MSDCAVCGKGFGPGVPALKAMGKRFHKGCMRCVTCKADVLGKPCVEKDGMPQCTGCADKEADAGAEKLTCKTCGKNIDGAFLRGFGFTFHKECAVCSICSKPLGNDGFYDDAKDKVLHLNCVFAL